MVEHNLAKVGVESSSLFSRSISIVRHVAGWQSGYAAACKAVDAGSIPTPASKTQMVSNSAAMAKQVDARDLKSLGK